MYKRQVKESAISNLTVTLIDVVNYLLEDEIKLLNEFEKLHKHKLKGGKLSYLEESFYNQIIANYAKK